ncbi:helix-turn-helix domain-containing protein [Mycobacterium kyogaense]|uniref:helix-turn-helix domain-containing protein n=1 Tax=Mycobacterium kyogaense TaxID=2212479 RepID=UPI0019699767|nr:helix-turn-helix transcriptional regulator [Mycobacterium kyogaense]
MAESEKARGTKARPLGDIGETVRSNLIRIREKRRMPVTELSERMKDAGRPIPALGLRRIEAGERRVDVDDLFALALALQISPITLLMPYPLDDPEQKVEVPGLAGRPTAAQLWAWLRAEDPLIDPGAIEDIALHEWVDFAKDALPRWVLREVAEYMQQELTERRRAARGNDQ